MQDSIHCERGLSPWNGFTTSWDEEQRGMKISSGAIAPELERIPRLDAYGPGDALLAIDRKGRRVVANAKFFTDLSRVDATRLGAEDTHALGTVKDPRLYASAKRFAEFLVVSDLIHTYAHVGSTLRIVSEKDSPAGYRAELDGEHEYYTNQHNTARVHFIVELDKQSGRVTVRGAS